jgi:hypothetical protein
MTAAGVVKACNISVDTDRKIVTMDPTTNMEAATGYIAIVTTNVKDLAGNALEAASIINFTTA